MPGKWCRICLGLWLIIAGAVQALALSFMFLPIVMGCLLIAAWR